MAGPLSRPSTSLTCTNYGSGGSILMSLGYVKWTSDLGLSSWFSSATRSCAGSALRQSRKTVRHSCGILSALDISFCWSCSLSGAFDVLTETIIFGSRARYPTYAVPLKTTLPRHSNASLSGTMRSGQIEKSIPARLPKISCASPGSHACQLHRFDHFRSHARAPTRMTSLVSSPGMPLSVISRIRLGGRYSAVSR